MNNSTAPQIRSALAVSVLLFAATVGSAGVTPVEPGHTLTKLVDSCAPLHPSQTLLDTGCALGTIADIESIAYGPAGGSLYLQLMDGGDPGTDTCILKVSPTGVVSVINPSTGFGGNTRGTDLILERSSGQLLTKDDNSFFSAGAERIATVNRSTGATGTYAFLPPLTFFEAASGLDFSRGAGGTDAPSSELLMTADLSGTGIHSVPAGGPLTTHLVPSGGGDDFVVQPDGDWVWIGDDINGIIAYDPAPAHPPTVSPLNVATIFAAAGRPFVYGTRATVCGGSGEVYISYSGATGGSAIFRLNEALTGATHVLDIGPTDGLQDLVTGRSTLGGGGALFFTVHDGMAGCEQVWELTLPECDQPLAIELASFEATVVPKGVRLEWTTVREVDNAGFRILRDRPGSGQKHATVMTPAPIPPRGSDLSGATYVWIDRSAQPDGPVEYWLEDIDNRGQATLHGPVIVGLPKSAPADDAIYDEKPVRTGSKR